MKSMKCNATQLHLGVNIGLMAKEDGGLARGLVSRSKVPVVLGQWERRLVLLSAQEEEEAKRVLSSNAIH